VVVTHNNKDLPSSVECRPPAEGDVRGFEEARVRKQGGQLRNRGSSLTTRKMPISGALFWDISGALRMRH
jgi:hypothetical protein